MRFFKKTILPEGRYYTLTPQSDITPFEIITMIQCAAGPLSSYMFILDADVEEVSEKLGTAWRHWTKELA